MHISLLSAIALLTLVLTGCSPPPTEFSKTDIPQAEPPKVDIPQEEKTKQLFVEYSTRKPEGDIGWLADGTPIFVTINNAHEQFWGEINSKGCRYTLIHPVLLESENKQLAMTYLEVGTDINRFSEQWLMRKFADSSKELLALFLENEWHATALIIVLDRSQKTVVVEFYDSFGANNQAANGFEGIVADITRSVARLLPEFSLSKKIHSQLYQIGPICWVHALNAIFARAQGESFEEFAASHQSAAAFSSFELERLQRAAVKHAHFTWFQQRESQKIKFVLTKNGEELIIEENDEDDYNPIQKYKLYVFTREDSAFWYSLKAWGFADNDGRIIAYAKNFDISADEAKRRIERFNEIKPAKP